MTTSSWLSRTHKLSRLPRLSQLPLGVEITLLLLLKVSILILLAKAFFSEPQAKHMRMPTSLVEQHLLSGSVDSAPTSASIIGTSAVPASDYSPTTTEVTHATH